MRRIAMLCALAATACSDATTTPASDEAKPVVEAAQAQTWPLQAGVYEYARSDGASGVNTLAPDGTYSDVGSDGETGSGLWGNEGKMGCFYSEDRSAKTCFTFAPPGADGTISGTADDGRTVSVRKID